MSLDSLNYTLSYLPTDDIELHDFDQNGFMEVMVVYAAPAAVALLVSEQQSEQRMDFDAIDTQCCFLHCRCSVALCHFITCVSIWAYFQLTYCATGSG